MAGALQAGWDQPADQRGTDRPALAPASEAQMRNPQLESGGRGTDVVDESALDYDDDDDRPCQEILREGCRSICSTMGSVAGGFCAAWFGAVHLQHFSADDAEGDDMPKSAAARAIRTQALETGKHWSSNFQRYNPKARQEKTENGWSGACRKRNGWIGEPAPRPEGADYYKHTFASTQSQPVLSRQYYPIFTILQCIFCMAIWLIYHWRDGTELAGLESIWPNRTDLTLQWDCTDYRSEAWRWWTYQWSHVGIAHVAFNCFMTLFFGIALEGVHGTMRMFLMFNIGVFGGSCCCFVADPHSRVVGMSGGCYALMGMHLGDVFMNYSEMSKASQNWKNLPASQQKGIENAWRKMIISPKVKLAILTAVITIDLVQSYLARKGGVSLSAHFGGGVAGFLACIVFGHNLVVKGHERVVWGLAFLCGGGLIAFCMLWGMSWPPRDIFSQVPWCWGRQIANVTAFGDNQWYCVRCPDDACIARWHIQRYIEMVTDRTCQRKGGWDVTDG
uniref:Peptidase S54 rhomboid domain-containing protein n=1 Tax=Alexandrium catenella TaxID=2925 RepID=A0A7S1WIT6_ALECA